MFSGHCGLLPEAVSVGYSLETAQGWTRDWETMIVVLLRGETEP